MSTRAELKSAAKFRAQCECGARSPRFATDYTTDRWMAQHEAEHRAAASSTGEAGTDAD